MTVIEKVRSAILRMDPGVSTNARTAKREVTFSLTSVGTPRTVAKACGTPSTTPLVLTCIPSGNDPAIKVYFTVPPSGSTATTGVEKNSPSAMVPRSPGGVIHCGCAICYQLVSSATRPQITDEPS